MTTKEGLEIVARELGREFQANPGTKRIDYYNDIAEYAGYEEWKEMPHDLRSTAFDSFRAGIEDEKRAQGSR